jgi:putative lipoprotein
MRRPIPSAHRLTLPVAIAAATFGFASSARADDPDPWFGPDKALHCGISAGLAGGGYALSALVLDRPWQRAIAGASFSLAIGGGKELYDMAGHGDASWKDFTWDVAGTAIGIGIALLVDAAITSSSSSSSVGNHASVHGSQLAIAF